jgi:PAS domain S-box-containing protein
MKHGLSENAYGIAPIAFIEAALEGFLVTTTDLDYPGPTVVYANPAFERMSGWLRAEIVGNSPRVLQGQNTDKAVFKDLRSKLAQGETWQGQTTNYRADGSEFVMEWSIAPVHNKHGETCFYLAVQRDVTARVTAERELHQAREAVVESLQKRALLRETFGRFVPEAILDQVVAQSGNLQPDLREATIFYSDIVGFSTLTEHMEPKKILQFLNEYFSLVTASIEARNGVIHQFQGDAILATFNLPLVDELHALNAVKAAMDVQEVIRSHRFSAGFKVETRIGINTGVVVAGTVGSSGRIGYTVHGDAVNLAARIENENKRFGTDILVAEETVERIAEKGAFEAVETITVRGRQQRVTLYRIAR